MNGSTSNHACIFCYVHKDYRCAVNPAKVLEPSMMRNIHHLIKGPCRPPVKKKGDTAKPTPRKRKVSDTDDLEDLEYGTCKEARGPEPSGKGPQGPRHFGKVRALGRWGS
jgi:hypothetical protein